MDSRVERNNGSSADPGDPYCGNCGYALKGLTDSSKCPECGKPLVETLMRRKFAFPRGRRFRSKQTIFGLPVIDVAFGPFGSERIGRARGFVAIGDIATGVLAIGGVTRGLISIGGVAVGLFSVGGLGVGLLTAAAGCAISTGLSVGGTAVGSIASGGVAIGLIAQGGMAIGRYARGGVAIGGRSAALFSRLRWLLGTWPPRGLSMYQTSWGCAIAPVILLSLLIGLFAYGRVQSD
jgi:hypothetical protein